MVLTVGRKYEIVATPTLTMGNTIDPILVDHESFDERTLTAGIDEHEHPRVQIRHNSLESLPSRHTTVRLRFVITVQTCLSYSSFARRQERGREREGGKEEQDHSSHHYRRNCFDLWSGSC